MDKLDHDRERNMSIARVGEKSGRKQAEQWPQPFAAAIHNIVTDARNHHNVGLQIFVNTGIHPRHIGLAQVNRTLQ